MSVGVMAVSGAHILKCILLKLMPPRSEDYYVQHKRKMDTAFLGLFFKSGYRLYGYKSGRHIVFGVGPQVIL